MPTPRGVDYQEGFCLLDKAWRRCGYRWKEVSIVANIHVDTIAHVLRCGQRLPHYAANNLRTYLAATKNNPPTTFFSIGDRCKMKYAK